MDKKTRYSKTSTMFIKILATIVLILGLCKSLEGKTLEEADCRPRPVPVKVSEDFRYKPYHVVLYQCTGTYKMISPSIKTCHETGYHDVTVDVKDEHGSKVAITLKNHTKCGGQCTNLACGKNMYVDVDCECRCLTEDCENDSNIGGVPSSGQSTGEKTEKIPLPYMVGMAMVGLFAVFVLVFDAMCCVKKTGFMYTIKHCCGKSKYQDKNEKQLREESQGMVSNGKKVTEV